jgi:hypothetical protein
MRFMRSRTAVLVAVLALALPAVAIAGAPFHLKPKTIHAGEVLKVYGGPIEGCGPGSRVIIYSKAFDASHEFAGVPAAYVKVRSSGKFTKHVRVDASTPAGSYSVGARCNGGNLGSRTLTVLNP